VSLTKRTLALGAFTAALSTIAIGQERAAPRDAGAVQAGGSLFRERCAECHGTDAKGVAGHDLTRIFVSGATDDRVFQTIRQGVPNTLMPSSTAPDSEIWALVSYIRSLNGSGTTESARGNAENGERIFWASCGSCHIVNGRGGPLGPDLSRITQNQSRDQLTRAIRDPNASIPDGYRTVTIVTRDGQRVRGVRKSEDAFSIQMMDEGGHLRGFLKASVRDVVSEAVSLMPAFGLDRLRENDLADVIAYLGRK
jgi:cytochrome c oxidase cbb3-type subunit III